MVSNTTTVSWQYVRYQLTEPRSATISTWRSPQDFF